MIPLESKAFIHIYLIRLHLGNIQNYFFFEKCVKQIKLICGVLEPGAVLKPGTDPRTSVQGRLPYFEQAHLLHTKVYVYLAM